MTASIRRTGPSIHNGERAPLVSVVIPCHNGADYIAQCIDSVRLQDHDPVEIVVVEDSSTDRSWEVIRRHSNSVSCLSAYRVSWKSPAKARNHGIRKARGSLIATLDADDYFLPRRLSKMLGHMQREQADMVVSDCFQILDGRVERFSSAYPCVRGGLSVEDYLRHIMPAAPMFLAKRSALERVASYNEDLKYLEDQDLFIRVLQNGQKISYLDEPLYVHRLHPEALSTAKVEESLAWREVYRGYRSSPKLNARQQRIVFLQLLATTFRYYYFRYASHLAWPKRMRILRRAF